MKFVFLAMIGCVSLAGCVDSFPNVYSRVTAFHNITSPQTFSVRPAPQFSGSLEAASYQPLIEQKLIEHGWQKSDHPKAIVEFAYGIDNGHQEISSSPVFGQTGGGGVTYNTGNIYTLGGGVGTYSGMSTTSPTYGVVGTSVDSSTAYNRRLIMTITEAGSHKRIYEATLDSSGSSGSFAAVSKCLIDSLFKNFPGKSGITSEVSVDGAKCMAVEKQPS